MMLNANVIVTVVRVMLTDTCPITCPSICSLANVVSARTIDVKNIKTVSYIITVPINIIISLFCESFVSENSFVSDLKTSSMANKSSSINTTSYYLFSARCSTCVILCKCGRFSAPIVGWKDNRKLPCPAKGNFVCCALC
jgi:hypothetical protein